MVSPGVKHELGPYSVTKHWRSVKISENDVKSISLTPYCCTVTLTLTFTFQPKNHVTSRTSQGHSQVWTSLCCHSFLSYAADKQTNKQTDGLERLSTPTDRVGVDN